MLKIIRDTFKKPEKEINEIREKIENQRKIIDTKTCPICGGASFDNGYIEVSGSHAVAVSDISTYHSGYNIRYDDLVHVCTTCGYVLLFADFKTHKRIFTR